MRSTLSLLAVLTAVACSGGGDDDKTTPDTDDTVDTGTVIEPVDSGSTAATGDTGSTTTETICLNSVLSRFPADSTTDAFYATSVEFELNTVELDASITVEGPDGPVPGASEVLGRRIRWTADEPLAPMTTYTGTLAWSCAPDSTTFFTSPTGVDVDPEAIDGMAYRLDLVNGRWLQPAGIGAAIPLLLGADILIGVESDAGDALDLTFARTDDFGLPQDLCEPTTAFPTASFDDNPLFVVGPADVQLEIDGAALPVYALELSGAFTEDGAMMEGGRLAGLADLAPLSPILAGSSDPTAICTLLAKFGVACFACPGGGPSSCVQIEVDSIRGAGEPGGVVPRSTGDIASDTTCN